MKRTFAYSLAIVFAGTLIALSSRSVISAGQVGAMLRLQSTTPGFQQPGHVNISGNALASRFGAGTQNPQATIHAYGNIKAEYDQLVSGSGPTAVVEGHYFNALSSGGYGGKFSSTGTYGIGIKVDGSMFGGQFTANPAFGGVGVDAVGGIGVAGYGEETGVQGLGGSYGVWGTSPGTSGHFDGGGIGVFGKSANDDGGYFTARTVSKSGVYAENTSATGVTYGLFGRSVSTQGTGVFGHASAASGTTTGVTGESLSSTGTGVYGYVGTASGFNQGVVGRTTSNQGVGLYGDATAGSGLTKGVHGQTSSSTNLAAGLFGIATAGTGSTFGVWGENNSTSGRGVYGSVPASTGTTYGGYFVSASTQGVGVYGEATATSGNNVGGSFTTRSATGTAVLGVAAGSIAGLNYGGRFQTYSSQGTGVLGVANSPNGLTTGVYGETHSNSDYAAAMRGVAPYIGFVFGGHFTGNHWVGTYGEGKYAGVQGRSVGDGTYTPKGGYFAAVGDGFTTGALGSAEWYGLKGSADHFGVYGESDSWGVYANGDLGASGAKSFRIDHPTDPENKYLLHYSAESPYPQNFYVGNVVTDQRGYAWVELPTYFSEINTNFKYQLTVVDDEDAAGFVMAKISNKIRGNRFQIRTSAAGVEVSWRVDADRDDLYMRHKKPQDVLDKPEEERGTYQKPHLYGLPKERGIDFRTLHGVPRKGRTQDEPFGVVRARAVDENLPITISNQAMKLKL